MTLQPKLPAAVLTTVLLAYSTLSCAWPATPRFDQNYGTWNALLHEYVVVVDHGHASRVRYAQLAKQRAPFDAFLESLQKVSRARFQGWSKPQRMAFLINAYNAFVIDKVLMRYPHIQSIWDFGRFFGNPFKDRFFTLLDHATSLDDIENDMLRKPGAFDDVRIHFAINCASIGCPMLRPEAYVAARLNAQLDDQARRFLSDRSRNRYNRRKDCLEVSKIFDWSEKDWERGWRNFDNTVAPITSVRAYLAHYADLLSDDAAARDRITAGKEPLCYSHYDWSLNDAARLQK